MVLHNKARGGRAGADAHAGAAVRVAVMAVALLGCAVPSHGQADPCDQLKTTLAGRLSMDPRSYTLESVPASTVLPAGAKVIGTCKGGAWKVVYRKGGGAPLVAKAGTVPAGPAAVAAVATRVPVAAAASAAKPLPPPVPVTVTPAVVSQPRTVVASRPAAPTVVAPPKPQPTPSALTGATSVGSRAVPVVPSTPATPSTEAMDAAASEPAEGWPFRPASAPAESDDGAPFGEATAALVREHWPWLAAAVGVPLAWGLWAGWSRRRDYDAAGLPRGPRL